MKKSILLLATIAVLAPCLLITTNAATQVYDLKADWSDTQNPNGTWSYRLYDGSLLVNYPYPWVDSGFISEAITKVTAASVVPGYLGAGDVFALSTSGVSARWTAPARGTINISGALWTPAPLADYSTLNEWTLTHNGIALSGGYAQFNPGNNRSSPYDLSLGSAGANALLNVQVEAGDRVELAFVGGSASGVNFTITLTPDSVDPVAAIEALAETVVVMNLQNGIENSLDSKLDAAVNALVDANVNNDGAACNSLAAFISAVQAQRGKKITNAQADQLIASARQIKAMLNCGN